MVAGMAEAGQSCDEPPHEEEGRPHQDALAEIDLWGSAPVRQHRYSNRGRTPSVTTHITRSKINTPMFSRGKTPTGKHPRPQPTRLLGAVY
jgi:hypothetical protein